jgi:hypothetical protein
MCPVRSVTYVSGPDKGVANSALAPREPSLSPSQPNSAMAQDAKRKHSNHITIALAAFAPLTHLLKFE